MSRRGNALNPSSSPLAYFGAELRHYREEAKLSLDQLGQRTKYSGSYIGAVERAKEMPLRDFAVAQDSALDARGALIRCWDGNLKDAVYPPWFDWPQHERQANLLRNFQLAVVHGLLQHEEYARHLLYGDEAAVAARIDRQRILIREDPPPPSLYALLDENVLHRAVGGPEVMKAQLEHLVAVASDQINIHIVPNKQHRGVNGSFVLATLPDLSEVAYMESGARGITTADPNDVRTLNGRFESLRSRALPVDQSLELIARTAKQRWS